MICIFWVQQYMRNEENVEKRVVLLKHIEEILSVIDSLVIFRFCVIILYKNAFSLLFIPGPVYPSLREIQSNKSLNDCLTSFLMCQLL